MALSAPRSPRPARVVPAGSSGPTPSALNALDGALAPLFRLVERVAEPFLRISLGVILLWIGLLKFHDPTPIVGLIQASFLFRALGFSGFVYALGVLEIIGALLLFLNVGVRYVGLFVALLFVGTLGVFLTAPMVTYGAAGFPFLSLAGQFLLKDLALMAGALVLVALDSARQGMGSASSPSDLRAELAELRRRMDRMEAGTKPPSAS
jgi:uncharacterized membrane protein YkgB